MGFRSGEGQLRLFAIIFGVAILGCAAEADLETGRKYYTSTDFERSLQVLQSITPKTGPVYELMGRDYYMQGEFKRASEAFEKAFAAEPANSDYALWLARAYGRRAETSSVFTAPGLASKAHQFFEKAVQLNPRNLEAQNDLFEYYLEAPGFLGGGFEKAQASANRIANLDASEGHWAQAKLAEKKKEYATAEEQLQRAIEIAPQQVGRLIDLARFLTKQGRYQEAEQSFAKAEKIAPGAPKLLFERAAVYVKSGRNLNVAQDLLKRYLSAQLTPDDPPRSEAAKLLKQAQGG
jgi:tetratricopeptide (TPR) repeat protein